MPRKRIQTISEFQRCWISSYELRVTNYELRITNYELRITNYEFGSIHTEECSSHLSIVFYLNILKS